MKSILFVSMYPAEADLRDGMMQRIASVDAYFNELNRTYLYISLKRNLKYNVNIVGNLTIIKANIFFHFIKIAKLVKSSEIVYIHSLWNYLSLSFFSLNKKKVVLDVHGIVPEELDFYNKKFQSWVFSLFESRLVKVVQVMIYVNSTMKDYYLNKYKLLLTKENYVCPVISKNIFRKVEDFDAALFREKLRILKNDVVFIYSGNIQKWQNFDYVINSIKALNNANYKFIILTNELEKVNKIISDESFLQSKRNQISVFSVSPKELYQYYLISHYGYVLRNDHILNRVSTPTKLLEYLFYGIIPIVKLAEIGDFNKLGYEYISVTNTNDNLQARRSEVNKSILKNLIEESYNIKDLIL